MSEQPKSRENRVDRLFVAASELPAADRSAFLDEECGSNGELRREVESLLQHDAIAHQFIVEPNPDNVEKTAVQSSADASFASIGPYQIQEQIGEGGMGEVYRAERRSPYRKTVAIKVIQLGMNSRDIIRRFHAERRVLAMMDHRNIAQVYDAGTTDAGRPYFVMEFVQGEAITTFCDENRYSVRDRLQLFLQLCEAIDHAHSKTVVHRDIKPSNVLVAVQDGKATVKVIDFGVAKALAGDDDGEQSIHTAMGGVVGTLYSMSPEQVSGRNGIDTKTDVYSLGVLLYELLCGVKPFEPVMLRNVSFDEQRRIICEVDPLRPSAQLRVSPEQARTIAEKRHEQPKQLARKLESELDWVVLKAMDKDRAKRYGACNELANELNRFLEDRPVRARPPSWIYRLRKSVRRHPTRYVTAIVLALATVFYLVQVSVHNRELEAELYFQRIAEAQQELAIRDTPQAIRLLQDCPEYLRGWEWHYLMRRVDEEPIRLRGHEGALWMADFSPDGTSVVTAGMDGIVSTWDANTGVRTKSIEAEPSPVLPTAFSWLPIDTIRRVLNDNPIPITCAAYSPDGKYVASGSFAPKVGGLDKYTHVPTIDVAESPGVVSIWDAASGTKIGDYAAQRGIIISLAFSPDGRFIASSTIGKDYTFSVWEVSTRKTLKVVSGHQSVVHRLRFSPDGRHLASADTAGTLKIWNTHDYSLAASKDAHRGPIIDVAFSNDASRIATASQDARLTLWNTRTLEKVQDFDGHQGAALGVAFSPDDTCLASSGYDRTVRLWDVETGRQRIALRGHDETVWSVRFDPSGKRLLSSSFDRTAIIWDSSLRTDSRPPEFFTVAPNGDRVNGVAFSPDGKLLASTGWDQTVRVCDANTGHLLRTLKGPEGSTWGVAFSPDSTRVASASWDRSIYIWDLGTSEPPRKLLGHTQPVHSVSFSPDGSRVLSGGWDGKIILWDANRGAMIRSHDGNLLPVMTVAFSHDGKHYASGGGDRMVRIWDSETGLLRRSLIGDTSVVYALAFSPDDRSIAAGGWDRGFKLWNWMDQSTDEPQVHNAAHQDRVTGVVFSRNGDWLATASEDNTVRLWDTKSGAELQNPFRHKGMVWSIAISPDGARLATGSWFKEGSVRTWPVPAH